MASNTVYYWQIIATDDINDSTAGPVWSFRTAGVVAPSGNNVYLSPSARVKPADIVYEDEDILLFDESTNSWSLFFDGSDVNLKSVNLTGFALQDDGSVLMTFDKPLTRLAGMNNENVDDSDIVRFVPTSLGDDTAGSFEMYFDGSDVGLTKAGEDIDALGFSLDGKLLISTLGAVSVPGPSSQPVTAADEDLLAFTPSSLGGTTSGTWELYVDGSDIHKQVKNLAGVWIDPTNGDLLLALAKKAVVAGVTVKPNDILRCIPSSLGETTSCSSVDLYWQGVDHGFGSSSYRIDAFTLKAD